MKQVVFLCILFLMGCCSSEHDRVVTSTPKYHYGDVVRVYSGFYKGVTAEIQDYHRCIVSLADGEIVNSWCYMLSKQNSITLVGPVSEQELTN